MSINEHITRIKKAGCIIISVEPEKKLIVARLAGAQDVPVNAFTFNPIFRWPKVGEEWLLKEENGSWFLDSIMEVPTPSIKAFDCKATYQKGEIVTDRGDLWVSIEEITPKEPCKHPHEGEGWKRYHATPIKPGDSMITTSSDRILQNAGDHVTEIPHGWKVPWIQPVSPNPRVTEVALAEQAKAINALREAILEYHMMLPKREEEEIMDTRLGTSSGEHLDRLYGSGSAEQFKKRFDVTEHFPGVHAMVTEYEGPPVTIKIEWTDDNEDQVARLQMNLYPERAHFASFIVHPKYRGQGFNTAILRKPPWWGNLGIKVLSAYPDSRQSEQMLAMTGYHWQHFEGQMLFASRIDVPDRMAEYRDWIEKGKPPEEEPQWRIALKMLSDTER